MESALRRELQPSLSQRGSDRLAECQRRWLGETHFRKKRVCCAPSRSSPFYPVDTKQSFPKLEEKILGFWQESNVFEASLAEHDQGPASPSRCLCSMKDHRRQMGSLAFTTSSRGPSKDVIPRYKTMRGYRVPRKAGWDCHGLPVEVEVEKAARTARQTADRRAGHRRV